MIKVSCLLISLLPWSQILGTPSTEAEDSLLHTIKNHTWEIKIHPKTLQVEAICENNQHVLISAGGTPHPSVSIDQKSKNELKLHYPEKRLNVSFKLIENTLTAQLSSDLPQSISWPIIKSQIKAKAFALPFHSGI